MIDSKSVFAKGDVEELVKMSNGTKEIVIEVTQCKREELELFANFALLLSQRR